MQNTDLYILYLCADASDECWLKECLACLRQSGISKQKLRLQETEDKITYALWENGEWEFIKLLHLKVFSCSFRNG